MIVSYKFYFFPILEVFSTIDFFFEIKFFAEPSKILQVLQLLKLNFAILISGGLWAPESETPAESETKDAGPSCKV